MPSSLFVQEMSMKASLLFLLWGADYVRTSIESSGPSLATRYPHSAAGYESTHTLHS